ncbi:MAG: ABC transporter ATP-binding protein [Planctomycetales bacterium]|nr:ABC transporter ATP-binding protein [Planctomycetales bacterium]
MSHDTALLYELRQVTKTYLPRGTHGVAVQVTPFDNVSLTIAEQEFVAVVGPSGSGKSTLLNLLAGMDEPTHGSVLYRAQSLPRKELDCFRRKQVGIVFQQFHLLPTLTAVENVALGLTMTGAPRRQALAEAHRWLKRLGIADRADHRPNELSGGQQQRVATARAMVKRPDVLLADEPTGNLDKQSRLEVLELLRELHHESQTTVVLVTHNLTDAEQYADRILLLDGGTILREWRPEKPTLSN